MAITHITIRLNTDDDAMVGGAGWGDNDARSSVQAFANAVANAVGGVYPTALIEVTPEYSLYRTQIAVSTTDDQDTHDVETHIHDDIISDVWQSWTWLVS